MYIYASLRDNVCHGDGLVWRAADYPDYLEYMRGQPALADDGGMAESGRQGQETLSPSVDSASDDNHPALTRTDFAEVWLWRDVTTSGYGWLAADCVTDFLFATRAWT